MSISPALSTAPSEYQTDLDAGMRPKVCLVGAVATSYKDTTEEQGPQGMGGCPRLIVCLLFEDEDDNHGDDDDRRNLSPSGSHYVSNLQATTAGDGGRLRRRTSRFLSPFPVLQSSVRGSWSARWRYVFRLHLFNTMSGWSLHLIFDFSNLRRPFYPIVRGWWMEEGGWEWDLRRRVERWYSLQKRYDRSYFFAYFDLDFRLFLLV